MIRTQYSDEVEDGKHVIVAGWVHEVRDLGKLVFVILRDNNGLLQIVGKKGDVDDSLVVIMKKLSKETVIKVSGKGVANPNAPNGIELVPETLDVVAKAEALPIDMSTAVNTALDKRLDFRTIDLRRPESNAVFKVQSSILKGMRDHLALDGFLQVFTPCIMGVTSEGGAEVFPVLYYDKEAFLRQDPQLHRQLTILSGFEKIFDIGPSWRAENSHTTRHLCEHRTVAVEMGFIQDEYDVIKLEQDMVIAGLKEVNKSCAKELEMFNIKLDIPKKMPVLEFPDIYDVLDGMGKKVEFGEAFDTEGEKMLGDYVKKKFKTDWFFVNRFPFAEKPFYVMRVDDDPVWARSTDLIYKGTELSSGGQREHRYDKIMKQAKEKGMDGSSISWFSDAFKWGAVSHGGFAIGIERITQKLLDLPNIRDAVLFPRDPERLVP